MKRTMEYPFKDLLPIDEVLEREGYYKDWTHLDPEVFYSLTQISEYIKTKGYGVDVRLLIAQLAEHFGLRVTQITDAMNEFNDLKPKAELSVSQSAEALTKSKSALNVANGIDAKATNALGLSESADTLSKSVQEQFNQVVIDGDSSVEAAQARVDASGHTSPTLKARLDKEHNEVTTQLAQTLSQNKIAQGYNKNTEPTIVFTFDDGPIEDLTVFKPILDQYGYKATTYIIGNRIGTADNLSIDDLKTLQTSGWEIGAHSMTHQPMGTGAMDEKVVEYEFSETKKLLNQNGFDARNFAYPFGSMSAMTNEIGVKYYDSLTMFGTGHNKINKVPIRSTYLNRVALGSFFDATNSTYPITDTFEDYYKKKIDELILEGGLLVFALHAMPHSQDATQIGYFEDTLEYINSKGLNVVTLEKALESFGNSIEIEKVKANGVSLDKYLKVSNGNLYTNMFHPTVAGASGVTNSTNAKDLPFNAKATYIVNVSDGFPVTGVLVHENNTEWRDFARQTLYSKGNSAPFKMLVRGSKTDGSWLPWCELTERKPFKLWHPVNDLLVPANGSAATRVDGLSPTPKDGIVANPDAKLLPSGITYFAYVASNLAYIRFQNMTSADITLTNRAFNVYLIDGN